MRFLIAMIATLALVTVVTAAPGQAEETSILFRDKYDGKYLFEVTVKDDIVVAELERIVAVKSNVDDKPSLFHDNR